MSYRRLRSVVGRSANDVLVQAAGEPVTVRRIKVANNGTATATVYLYHPFGSEAPAEKNMLEPGIRVPAASSFEFLVSGTSIDLRADESLWFNGPAKTIATAYGD